MTGMLPTQHAPLQDPGPSRDPADTGPPRRYDGFMSSLRSSSPVLWSFALCWLAPWSLACTTDPATSDSSPPPGGTETGWCAVDPMELGLSHRASAPTCAAKRAAVTPEPTTCDDYTGTSTRFAHADCTDGANGRCIADGIDVCSCHYDECASDADCPSGEACSCGEVSPNSTLPVNTCIPADCRLDADCAAGLCLPERFHCGSAGPEDELLIIGYVCASADDACRNDETCFCADETERCTPTGDHLACSRNYDASCD